MKKRISHGLSYVFTLLLCIAIAAGITLEYFSTAVDSALGTTSSVIVADGETYTSYTPDAQYLNADGTGNSEALIGGAIELGRKMEAEGVVLLKNEGNALPLASGSNVTMLGARSYWTLLAQNTGNTAEGAIITLWDALSGNRTDFNNSRNWVTGSYTNASDFEFDGAGYNLNPAVKEAYEKINETYGFTHLSKPLPVEYDPNEPNLAALKASGIDFESGIAQYNDAAIVTVGRPASEACDYTVDGMAEGTGATDPLGLTTAEREIIDYACENFDRVIVLVNTVSAMEIGELQDNEKIDAILWIGLPGNYGTLGIGDVLTGKVSPSGALADTYAEKNASAPAVMNLGLMEYANLSDIDRNVSKYYLIEAEGIYTGYRYYETRYYDTVANPETSNAASTAGACASTAGWNYAEEVVYSFGYGLSYTTFSQEIMDVAVNKGEHELTMDFTVKVTNIGDTYSGKSIAQLYGQAPYEEGTVEKSAVQLLNFGKTQTLAPGESETLTITVDLQNIASYDENHDNGDGTFGTYILDAGDYYFSLGNGAHDALNNILAAQGYSVENGMDYNGNASVTYVYSEITELDDKTFSVTKSGETVSNQLECADWNNFEEGAVTYLSRADWEGTYPKRYSDMTATEEMIRELDGLYYEVSTGDDTSSILWGQDNGLSFYDMKGITWDDERWDAILDQITYEEALVFNMFGGPCLPSLDSLGLLSADPIENGGNGVDLTLGGTKDPEAPWAISNDDPNANWNGQVFAAVSVMASSFNTDLAYEYGVFLGNESLFTGISVLWGPGNNLHRTAYSGRNGDYFSEDPILTAYIVVDYAAGCASKGQVVTLKHLAFNDQEQGRDGISPYKTEQACREVELRSFQLSIESGVKGVMTSYSKIGTQECTSCYNLLTGILKKEWGFHGYVVSDGGDDMDLFAPGVVAGLSSHDLRGATASAFSTDYKAFKDQADGIKISEKNYANDATIQQNLKQSAKGTLYFLANSNLMNRYAEGAERVEVMTSWRWAYCIAIGVSAVATLGCAVMFMLPDRKKEKKEG